MKKLSRIILAMSGLLLLTNCAPLSDPNYIDISKIKKSRREVRIYDRHVRVDIKGRQISIAGKKVGIAGKQIYYIDLDETKKGIESYVVLKDDEVLRTFCWEELERKGIKYNAEEDLKKLEKEGIRDYEVSDEMRGKFARIKSFLDLLLFIRQKQGKTPLYRENQAITDYTFEIFSIIDSSAYAEIKNETVEDQFSDLNNPLYEIFWNKSLCIVRDPKTNNEYNDYGLDSFILGTRDSAEEGSKKCSYSNIAYKVGNIKEWKEKAQEFKEHYESIIREIDSIFLERYGNRILKFKIGEEKVKYNYKTTKADIPEKLKPKPKKIEEENIK